MKIKNEVKKILYSKKSFIIFSVIISIMVIENIVIYFDFNGSQVSVETLPNPLHALFLAGFSRGHILQIIFLWFLPIFMLLIYSDKTIDEFNTGHFNTLIVKESVKKYVLKKIVVSTIMTFIMLILAFALNWIIASIIFCNGETTRFTSWSLEQLQTIPLLEWQCKNPVITNIIYILNVCFFASIITIISNLIAILIKDKKLVYISSFFIWFFLVTRRNYSLMLIFQPFTEFDLNYQFNTFIQSFSYLIIIMGVLLYLIFKRRDYVE